MKLAPEQQPKPPQRVQLWLHAQRLQVRRELGVELAQQRALNLVTLDNDGIQLLLGVAAPARLGHRLGARRRLRLLGATGQRRRAERAEPLIDTATATRFAAVLARPRRQHVGARRVPLPNHRHQIFEQRVRVGLQVPLVERHVEQLLLLLGGRRGRAAVVAALALLGRFRRRRLRVQHVHNGGEQLMHALPIADSIVLLRVNQQQPQHHLADIVITEKLYFGKCPIDVLPYFLFQM
mmetsp:Transcript_3259/g.7760  ORF Transcript_3259/g.7760 Transcript_3259/m.7760 type:complete len:237 (-) Transcript_3259:444-1154(-)